MLPTIRSRCQLVRFEPLSEERIAAGIEELGAGAATALACVRLALQDGERARELAREEGQALRAAAESFARSAIAGEVEANKPWIGLLAAVRARGDAAGAELEAMAAAELELTARRERKRVETEWTERTRRTRRRVQTGTLDLGLQLAALWFADLASLAWGADDLVRNCDRLDELRADAESDGGSDPGRLRAAIELVEDTRLRFELNVSEELACEALAYRLEQTLVR